MVRPLKPIINSITPLRLIALKGVAAEKRCDDSSRLHSSRLHSSSRILLRSFLLQLFTCMFFSSANQVFAQDNISIIHNQLRYEEIPSPGELFKLSVSLQGTREVHPHIKLIMLMDGKLLEYPLGTGKFNSNNQPEFELLLPAPESELSYQFILPIKSGEVLSSKQFSYKRQCAEKRSLTVLPIAESDQGALFKGLSQAAADLEYEVKLYRVADELLQKVKASLRNVPSEDGE